ncbi:MAG: DUF4197 domain-containing protein [Thermodesulfovibrionales bacterium]
MRKAALASILILLVASASYAGFLDDLKRGLGIAPAEEGLSDDTVVSGLKEALSVASEKAVGAVSRTDGYFANPDIKILFPEKIRKVGEVLSAVGYQRQVDDFVLSMNRAAEKAAAGALPIFADAITEMTFEDARGILEGGDTSATEYFKAKTSERLYESFKPIVSSSMDEVGVTRSYKEMMGRYSAIPLAGGESIDLDHYVTGKSLDGLFFMLGEEEKKIRTDPAARVTDLLRKVFGG